jgi:multiple sugar transport system ATP-binding protein
VSTLAIDRVSKSFGATQVLKGVSLDIEEGEFLSLVGASGCGKTTLLRIIAGLDFADTGSVRIGDQAVDHLAPKARDVAMVFQSYALYPYMTVGENIALPLAMRWMNWRQRLPIIGRWWAGAADCRAKVQAEVTAVAQSLGLAALLDRKPANLSGGQRQRVALARAMVRHPKVFLMDEPLSNLDAKLRTQTRAEIAELHRRLGATFVYVTHDQVEAMTMSDRVALMVEGQIVQVAHPQVMYDDPCDLRVAEFIGTPKINVLPAVATDRGTQVLGFMWPLHVDAQGEVLLAVRPEWWTLGAGLMPVDDDVCSVVGQVDRLELLGSETLVHVRVDGMNERLVAKVPPHQATALHTGSALTLTAPTDRILAFAPQGKRLSRRDADATRDSSHDNSQESRHA